jgi:hypothetical protein
MKRHVVRLLSCICGALMVAALSATTNQAQAEAEHEMPVYVAPQHVIPRARLGGSLRGAGGEDPVVAALVPDHVGLTIRKQPELNWFLSKHTSLPIRFTLIDERSIRALLEHPLAPPYEPGVHAVKLSDAGFTLQPDIQYRWYISIIRDPESPSRDIVTGGIIERCDFSECMLLDASTSCSLDAVRTNASNGFWYDAMGCLCQLIEAAPDDMGLRKLRAALLKQVGLNDVAEWDLAQSHATHH